MPGPNTTGTPNPSDYVFARGEVYAGLLDANDLPSSGYVHLGNCPDFLPSVAIEKAEHFSSMSGIKSLDLTTIIQATSKLAFTLEEFNEFNLSQFLKGSVAVITNPAVAGFAEINQAFTGVTLGRWYDIMTAAGVRAYNLQANKITLEKDAGADVLLVENTDYILDLVWGRFKLLSTAVNIAAGDAVNVTLAADVASVATYRRIQGLQSVGAKYAICFIFKNAANASKQLRVEFHKVSLDPSGDLALITSGNDYAQMKFEAECLASSASRYSASPTVDIDYHTAA